MSIAGRKYLYARIVLMPKYNVIELGGGNNPVYHPNIDIFKCDEVDIVCDLSRHAIPLPDSSVGTIYSQDFIEHISLPDFFALLGECKRILKPEGHIDFIVPDIAEAFKNQPEWNEHLFHIVVGTWDNERPYLRHKAWWTAPLMSYVLHREGWANIKVSTYKKDSNWRLEPKFRVVAYK
jgi:predicted SAM-dependent methyltransferase